MASIATALDKLQGDNECYLWLFMPTIQQAKKKLISLAGTVIHCRPLVYGLIQNLVKRFSLLFQFSASSNISATAAVCHPNFKLRWVPGKKKHCVKAAFLEEARKCAPNPAEAETGNMHISGDDFFSL